MGFRFEFAGLCAIGISAFVGCADAGSSGAEDPVPARTRALSSGVPRPASDIVWAPCNTTSNGECATIQVPIDWAHPEGEKFDLAIGRVPALEPENRIGVLFLNPGGPGSSGIDFYITSLRGIPEASILRKRFDLVSWDPRGVARSHPVLCGEVAGPYIGTFPKTESEYRIISGFNARLAENCRAHTGPLFDHVDTLSTTRDMDAIRTALGEEKLSYFGLSYGSQIGVQYAEEFPERIRAMTLDSIVDHSVPSVFRFLQKQTEEFEESFLDFVAWCGRTPECKLHGRDVAAVWDGLYEKAVAGTLVDPTTGRPVTGDDLQGTILFVPMAVVSASRWFALANQLSSLETGVPLAAPRAVADDEFYNFPSQAILCQDWDFRIHSFHELDAYRRALEAMYPHTRISTFWPWVVDCLGAPIQTTNPQRRISAPDAPPILLVTARRDVSTPQGSAVSVHRQLKGSVLLQHDGLGHAQFNRNACARQYMETYLTTLAMPPKGTRCPTEFP